MEITYKKAELCSIIDTINSQQSANDDFFKESLYMVYPQFDRKIVERSNLVERKKYIASKVNEVYRENEITIDNKVIEYQKFWNREASTIQKGLENFFKISLDHKFNDVIAYVGINPICARYLENNTFDAFFKFSANGMTVTSIHEIIHFLWFYKWHELFADNKEDYENPSLKWILSEMVVDLIIEHSGLNYLNPEKHMTIYPYFHDAKIDNEKILDKLELLIETNDIDEFMVKAYNLCIKYEGIIRSVMY